VATGGALHLAARSLGDISLVLRERIAHRDPPGFGILRQGSGAWSAGGGGHLCLVVPERGEGGTEAEQFSAGIRRR